jgi:hypothetical protein
MRHRGNLTAIKAHQTPSALQLPTRRNLSRPEAFLDYVVVILSRRVMNERLPYGDMKLARLARKTIDRQKQLLGETDQLLRSSRDLISRTQELIRQNQQLERLSRILSIQRNGNH